MSTESESIVICEGELELIRIKMDMLNEVTEFHREYFLGNEPICSQVLNLANCDIAQRAIASKLKACLEDEISFAVRHRITKELVAIRINKILTNATVGDYDFPIQTPALICVHEFLRRMYNSFDLFKEWNIDCAWEFSFLATRSDYHRRGLGTILSKHSIEFARQMLNGTLKEKSILPAHIRDLKPKAVCSVYTSKFTQKIGEQLGMQTLVKIPLTEFFYEGKSFAEKINPIHDCATFVALKL